MGAVWASPSVVNQLKHPLLLLLAQFLWQSLHPAWRPHNVHHTPPDQPCRDLQHTTHKAGGHCPLPTQWRHAALSKWQAAVCPEGGGTPAGCWAGDSLGHMHCCHGCVCSHPLPPSSGPWAPPLTPGCLACCAERKVPVVGGVPAGSHIHGYHSTTHPDTMNIIASLLGPRCNSTPCPLGQLTR